MHSLKCGHFELEEFANRRCMLRLIPGGCGTMRRQAFEDFYQENLSDELFECAQASGLAPHTLPIDIDRYAQGVIVITRK